MATSCCQSGSDCAGHARRQLVAWFHGFLRGDRRSIAPRANHSRRRCNFQRRPPCPVSTGCRSPCKRKQALGTRRRLVGALPIWIADCRLAICSLLLLKGIDILDSPLTNNGLFLLL